MIVTPEAIVTAMSALRKEYGSVGGVDAIAKRLGVDPADVASAIEENAVKDFENAIKVTTY